ncbi:MAG: GNAT family N-acetyltransferase [Propioniciclava sp.]
MIVRPATSADLHAVAELAAATFPLACPPGLPEADIARFVADKLSMERFSEHLATAQTQVLVAEGEHALLGYTLAFAVDPDAEVAPLIQGRPTVELSKCYTRKDVHGTGVSTALMSAVVDAAQSQHAASVWLGVNGQNLRAQRFYAKHGFAVVGERRFVVGSHTEDDLVLERPLL